MQLPTFSIPEAKLTSNVLTYYRRNESSLFSQKPFFWKLSDLSMAYSQLFNIKKPVDESVEKNIYKDVTKNISDFSKIIPAPTHILNVSETYNLNRQTIKNGKNQYLTNVACEYLMRTNRGPYLAQAYFMSPSQTTSQEIINTAQELRFERIRERISYLSSQLYKLIKYARFSTPTSYQAIWGAIWHSFYSIRNKNELYEKYGVKDSPINHISNDSALADVACMLQIIVQRISDHPNVTINDVRAYAINTAYMARIHAINNGTAPEKMLSDKNTYNRIKKIRKARERFWLQNYPLSLTQR